MSSQGANSTVAAAVVTSVVEVATADGTTVTTSVKETVVVTSASPVALDDEAYAVFMSHKLDECKAANPDNNADKLVEAEAAAELEWKEMDAENKAMWGAIDDDEEEMELNDSAADGAEAAGDAPPKRKVTRARKGKAMKDPNAPKRNLSAYFFFINEKRPMVKETNKEAKMTDIVKLLATMWNGLNVEQKEPYAKLAAEDKERYEREKTEHAASHVVGSA